MSDRIYTVEDVMDWPPCPEYPEERVRELLGDGLTIEQILNLDIPVQDRVWAGVHALDPRRRCAFAAAATRRTCEFVEWEHPDSLRAIEAAEALGRGEEVEGIEEIRAAALRTADVDVDALAAHAAHAARAARVAARVAARGATASVAAVAAAVAADAADAAGAAADDAAYAVVVAHYAASSSAERERQLEDIKRLLEIEVGR